MLKGTAILSGLLFSLLLNINTACAALYTVEKGDSLWKISREYNISIDKIVELNNLKSHFLSVGQVLQLNAAPVNVVRQTKSSTVTATPNHRPMNHQYLVKSGDTLGGIAKKFAVTVEELRTLNNIRGDTIYAGQTLALKTIVSRGYINRPEAAKVAHNNNVEQGNDHPARYGQLIDWFSSGKNILKPGKTISVTDTQTGKTMLFKVLGGSNHCDVEPLTKEDTETMRSLFSNWTWEPRPVCIHTGEQDIAASLSGMPHSNIENINDNNVTGHFDMYLLNSKPHGSGVSRSYVQQHYDALLKAAVK